jgi:nitronate monooxygenase
MKTAAPLAASRRLGIEHPIVQGPFGGGLSTAMLVGTVSNLGGLGSFGAYHLPAAEIAPLARELRSRTDRPFAINLWVSDHDRGGASLTEDEFEATYALYEPSYRELGIPKPQRPTSFFQPFEDQAWALIEAAPPAFSFVFGVPSAEILSACRKRDIVTIGAATSLAEARLLEEAGVDLLVATGFEAAGHRPSFLRRAEDSLMGTFALTQVVSEHVRTPVVAAGGIVDGRGVRAAFALGAQAVQLGTAFLACEESGATAQHREALFSPLAEETRLTRTYTGRLARGIPNRVVERFEACGRDLPPFPIHSWFVSKLRAADAAGGRSDFLSLYASQSAPNVRHRTATGLMHSLIEAIA